MTKAYRKACSEGEVPMYRAHVALLGDSYDVKNKFIEALLGESRFYHFAQPHELKGVQIDQFKSKFNKDNQETKRWKESLSSSSSLKTEFRNAVLSHIRSLQHDSQAKEEMEIPQKYHISSSNSMAKKSFVTRFELNKTKKQRVRQNITYNLEASKKELEDELQKPDNETLFFLRKNAQIEEVPENNIPYSINLWDFDSQDKFSAMNHSFLKAEALICYAMDIRLDLFSPLRRSWGGKKININPKPQAELLKYWFNSVHIQAKKQNIKPNIVLLLTGSIRRKEQSKYTESYIKTIIDLVEGKPYASYISEENIILVDNHLKSFANIRGKVFDMIVRQPNWGAKRPIRWLHLEAELLRRTKYEDKRYLHRYEIEDYDDDDNHHYFHYYHAKREPHILVSEVKELASVYGMDDCEMNSFLEFHHDLGNFICTPPSKSGHLVIIHPQWLLDKVSQLLAQVSNTQRHDEHRHELLHYLRPHKAIVSIEDLRRLWRKNAQFLADLMMNFHFLFPINSDENLNQTYLIPCMLPLEKSYLHEKELTYSSVHIARELEVQHVETFQTLLCLCANQTNWKLSITDHQSHYHASFDVNLGTHLVLNPRKNNTIEVSTRTSIQELDKGHISNDGIRAFLLDIHKDMARKMETLGVTQSKVFRILCPHWTPGDEHLCLVEIEEQTQKRPDNFVFRPISDRCAIHKKVLEPFVFSTTEHVRIGK